MLFVVIIVGYANPIDLASAMVDFSLPHIIGHRQCAREQGSLTDEEGLLWAFIYFSSNPAYNTNVY